MTSKEILEIRVENPEKFYEKVSCDNCPVNSLCSDYDCKNVLNRYLDHFAESRLYTIDNGIESFVVELTPEQEKFLSWLDNHNFFCNSPKEYKEPNIYKI